MIENVKKSFQVMKDLDNHEKCQIIKDYVPGKECDTSFKYDLTVKKGKFMHRNSR